jgi:hypothetical protein
MNWRIKKQLKYLFILFIFLILIFYLMYFVVKNKNLDSCLNGVKDKGEIGIDCGGKCPPCELKNFKFLKRYPVEFLEYENKIDIIGLIENPNENLALKKFIYYFEIRDESGNLKETTRQKSSILAPLEKRYLIELNYPKPNFKIGSIDLKIIEPSKKDWISSEFRKIPVSYYNFKTRSEGNKTIISLTLFNQSYYDYPDLEVILLLYKNADLISVNKSFVSLKAEENKEIFFFVPQEFSNFTDFYLQIQKSSLD